MSLNIVDATIELSDEYDVPIILIASRRQIDSSEFNGGYVNNWSTDVYSEYVNTKCRKKKIILARDHGGPWQNTKEVNLKLNLDAAMESAKQSFKKDIDSGFEILHIDTSIDIHKTPDTKTVLERIFELYEYSYSYAKSKGKDIIFEIADNGRMLGDIPVANATLFGDNIFLGTVEYRYAVQAVGAVF